MRKDCRPSAARRLLLAACALLVCLPPPVQAAAKKGAVQVVSGRTGETVRTFKGGVRNGLFGSAFLVAAVSTRPEGALFIAGEPLAGRGAGQIVARDFDDRRKVFTVAASSLAGPPVGRFGWSMEMLDPLQPNELVAIGAPATDESAGIVPTVVVGGVDPSGFTELYRLEGEPGSGFGAEIGMVALDNLPAFFAVSAPGAAKGRKRGAGAVFLFDNDGDQLWVRRGSSKNLRLGSSLDVLGDAFGADGIYDLVVGAPGPADKKGRGRVVLLDGASGRQLEVFRAPPEAGAFGAAVSALQANGDQILDFVVGAPETDTETGEAAGCVYLISGLDGEVLARFSGTEAGQRLGTSVEAFPLDGDSTWEIAMGSVFSEETSGARDRGRVEVVSLTDTSSIVVIGGKKANQHLGGVIRRLGDFDLDGFGDLYVARPAGPRLLQE